MARPTGVVYKDEMWRHLAKHRVSFLGVQENGTWRKREYPHILPSEHQHLNILEPYRQEFWTYFRQSTFRLHPDFHHLSSSQAMCFNLFFPFIAEQKKYMQVLRDVFTTDGVIEYAEFEGVLDSTEGTNFDFWFKTAASKTLFEVKLTESGFGTAARDDSHIAKFESVYSPAMTGKFASSICSCEAFLGHYQLMRNIWNLNVKNSDTLVFVLPRANNCLVKDVAFLDACLSEEYRQRVCIEHLEILAATIETVIPDNAARMKEHFRLFREKYFPDFSETLRGCVGLGISAALCNQLQILSATSRYITGPR